MDYIHIDDLRVSGKHGVGAEERAKPQEFLVSVRLGADTRKAAASGRLEDTIDYHDTLKLIENVFENTSHSLLETLAEHITAEILKDKRVHSVELTIKKTGVWRNGIPGVTILREQVR